MPARPVWLVPVLGLLLAGCTGASGERPKTLPPVSPSPSASVSPSAVAVEVPAEARAETPQGAAAFARFYLATLAGAYASGDSRDLQALSHPDCDTCNNFIRVTDEDAAKGLRFEGGAYTVTSAATPAFTGGDIVVDLQFDRAPSREYDASGRLIGRGPAELDVLMQMRVIWSGAGWIARGIRFPKRPT